MSIDKSVTFYMEQANETAREQLFDAASALRLVVEGTSASIGESFFRSLVQCLSQALQVRYAFVSECFLDCHVPRVRTLAFWNGSGFSNNFEYPLENTPCQEVLLENGAIRYYPCQVRSTFPYDLDLVQLEAESYLGVPICDSSARVLGHLVVMHTQPLDEEPLGLPILQIFAARAGAELERQRMTDQLLREAHYDALTQLPNRLLFRQQLQKVYEQFQQHPYQQFAVLFLDLDRFKVINDSLGHSVGDELLVAVAQHLQAHLRPCDMIARLGGDEFGVLVSTISNLEEAIGVAQQLQQALSEPFHLRQYELFVSASIGIAFSDSAALTLESYLCNADIAMYQAKSLGRSNYAIFDTKMHINTVSRLQREIDLRRAIDQGNLRLHFQPIISLDTSQVIGFEALIRWYQPNGEIVSPSDFIPLAEETGLIISMGWWVLQESCYQLRDWQIKWIRPDLMMSINLSSIQFSQPGLVDHISRILDITGLDPKCLRIEITESTLMQNFDAAAEILNRLKALGLQLYLDDFGIGYSSLSTLYELPIDALKIDRSFIKGIDKDERHLAIVKTIVSLSENLKMAVVAEGIETAEQLDLLRSLGCNLGQGYYFSPPLDSQSVETWRYAFSVSKNHLSNS
ncbi:MAG: hypothetical protein Kow00121_33750 [Elainellaceae cyanobacterium]